MDVGRIDPGPWALDLGHQKKREWNDRRESSTALVAVLVHQEEESVDANG
jgi:hypothetical protein